MPRTETTTSQDDVMERFERGEDILEFLDLTNVRVVHPEAPSSDVQLLERAVEIAEQIDRLEIQLRDVLRQTRLPSSDQKPGARAV